MKEMNSKTKVYDVEVYHRPTERVIAIRHILGSSKKEAKEKVRLIYNKGGTDCANLRFIATVASVGRTR